MGCATRAKKTRGSTRLATAAASDRTSRRLVRFVRDLHSRRHAPSPARLFRGTKNDLTDTENSRRRWNASFFSIRFFPRLYTPLARFPIRPSPRSDRHPPFPFRLSDRRISSSPSRSNHSPRRSWSRSSPTSRSYFVLEEMLHSTKITLVNDK